MKIELKTAQVKIHLWGKHILPLNITGLACSIMYGFLLCFLNKSSEQLPKEPKGVLAWHKKTNVFWAGLECIVRGLKMGVMFSLFATEPWNRHLCLICVNYILEMNETHRSRDVEILAVKTVRVSDRQCSFRVFHMSLT